MNEQLIIIEEEWKPIKDFPKIMKSLISEMSKI